MSNILGMWLKGYLLLPTYDCENMYDAVLFNGFIIVKRINQYNEMLKYVPSMKF